MGTPVQEELTLIYEEDIRPKTGISQFFFAKIASTINYFIQNGLDYVGKIESCALTEEQFAMMKNYNPNETDLTVKKWVMLAGQNISGSDYAIKTGITVLPNMLSSGAFLGQKQVSDQMLEYQESQNKSHTHQSKIGISSGSPYTQKIYMDTNLNRADQLREIMLPEGGSVARPNTVRVNIFIKIND